MLHRLFVIAFAAAILLYGGRYALASEAPPARAQSGVVTAPAGGEAVTAPANSGAVTAPAKTPPPLAEPLPLTPGVAPPAQEKKAAPADGAEKARPAAEAPHIALLLPLDAPPFVKHAEAVKNGFLAAAKVQKRLQLPMRVYAVSADDRVIVEAYRRALDNGARLIVGPLTRSGVSAIAESALVMVPTLALNIPERRTAPQRDLYMLSLHAESEARQVAQLAFQEGRQNAVTLYAETPLLKRIQQAFVEEFTKLGGKHVAEFRFSADQSELSRLRQAAGIGVADMAFLALDFPRARLARAYLGRLALYATSHVYPGDAGPLAGFDLANIRFLDMPWVLQPDHPAVMVYPRQDHRDVDLDRFYALGIDAFRISQEFLAGNTNIALDGVIGKLKLGSDHTFERTLTAAQYNDGKLRISVEGRDAR